MTTSELADLLIGCETALLMLLCLGIAFVVLNPPEEGPK